jgi:Flp pilus assembly pilin Flp
VKQAQKSIFTKLINNNRGQAVVEYVLLAIIVVSLIIGMGKVFTALDDGFNQYMGGYISCLMEYGELPSLGVQEADLKKHTASTGKKCDAQFASFSFAEGRPPTGGGGSAGSNSGSSTNQSSSSGRGSGGDRNADASGDGKATGNGVGDSDSDGGDSSGGFAGGSGGRGRGGDRGKKSGASQGGYATADSPMEFENTKTRVIEDEEADSESARNKGRRRRNLTNNGGYEPYRAITGRMKQELEKQQKRRSTPRQPTRTVTTLTKEELRFVPVKKPISRAVAAEGAEMKDSGNNFTFGNIIRWLLIAAMVLAIIIFFGGQVLNYSNSKD